mgnify:CR=1 FL=1
MNKFEKLYLEYNPDEDPSGNIGIGIAEKFYKKCKRKAKGTNVHLSYHFYPTGIGNCVVVRSETLKIEEDIE